MTACPHAEPIDDRKARCTLANARVSIPRVCGPCQASWPNGQPPTPATLPPILVSITNRQAFLDGSPQPPLTTQLLTAGKAFLAFVRSGGKRLPKADREARLSICKGCHKHQQGRCLGCGCFVSIKTWLPDEHCPLRLWPNDPAPAKAKRCGHCGK